MEKTGDLTRGSVSGRLLGFFFPMLLTNALQQAYAFADTVIVGKGIGDLALGAVGNLSSLMLMVTGFLTGTTQGFSVCIAQAFGAGDYGLMQKRIARSIRLSGWITAAWTLVSVLLLHPLLLFLRTAPVLMRDSLLYGYIFFASLFVTMAYHLCACILRAVGDSRTPLLAIILSSALNIALDCLLVLVLRAGVAGAAAATAMAQAFSVVICLRRLRRRGLLRLKIGDFAGDRTTDMHLLHHAIPSACMNTVTAVGCMAVQGYINALGAAFTSAYSACSRYLNLCMLPSLTAGFSLSAFVSQNKGAGETVRIRKGVRVSVGIAAVSWLIIGSVMACMPERLAGLVLSDAQTIASAAEYLRICAVTLFLLNLLFVFRGAVQGMGYPVVPMCSGALEMGLRIAVIVLLMKKAGFRAAAYAECAAWLGALLLNGAAYTAVIRREARA